MAVRHFRTSLWCIFIAMFLIPMGLASAESGLSCSPPPYAFNRADDNYQYLREPECRTSFWDPIKYMPLDASGTWYLPVGGEARTIRVILGLWFSMREPERRT